MSCYSKPGSDRDDVPEEFWVLANIYLLAGRAFDIMSELEDELSVFDTGTSNECGAAWVWLENFQQEFGQEAHDIDPRAEISDHSISDQAGVQDLADAYLAYAGRYTLKTEQARIREIVALADRAQALLTQSQKVAA